MTWGTKPLPVAMVDHIDVFSYGVTGSKRLESYPNYIALWYVMLRSVDIFLYASIICKNRYNVWTIQLDCWVLDCKMNNPPPTHPPPPPPPLPECFALFLWDGREPDTMSPVLIRMWHVTVTLGREAMDMLWLVSDYYDWNSNAFILSGHVLKQSMIKKRKWYPKFVCE